jgi:hypothetical protein
MRQKTIDELEGVAPRELPPDQTLERVIHELRQIPIGELSLIELRRAWVYRVGIPYLVPLAVEHLEANPLMETLCLPGDLLVPVLQCEPHWGSQQELRPRVRALVKRALARLAEVGPIDWAADEVPDVGEPDEDDRERLEPILRDALGTLG